MVQLVVLKKATRAREAGLANCFPLLWNALETKKSIEPNYTSGDEATELMSYPDVIIVVIMQI